MIVLFFAIDLIAAEVRPHEVGFKEAVVMSIFYTVLGEAPSTPGDYASTAAALESAKGLLRSEVAKQLGMRHAPTLTFVPDEIPEAARHLDEVLAQAKASDAEVEAARRGATYAGDADPYKKPRGLDDDEADEE